MVANSQIHIRVTDDYKYQCFRTPDGIERHDVGPAWDTPKQAIAYADELTATP